MSLVDVAASGADQPPPQAAMSSPAKDGSQDNADFMRAMRARYDLGISRDKPNREKAVEDLDFKIGNQWPQTEIARRGSDRPTLTFPKLLPIIRQVTGDVRQNKPAIKVRPKGEGADKPTADVFGGLIRDVEERSSAGYVYAQGGENSVSCGRGAWRIKTEYASDETFDQDIFIKAIPNALSVVWDPDAIELDRSDAKWCFVYSSISEEDFKTQYPDAKLADFESNDPSVDDYGDWFAKDGAIRVAEYWRKTPTLKTVCLLSDGRVICKDDYDPQKLAEVYGDATEVKSRTIKAEKVTQHIVSGAEELETPAEWPTDDIPIIHVPGEETWVNEQRHTYGLVRFAKDAQRAYNYTRSTSVEVVALQPKAPYLLSRQMIEGLEDYWKNAGNANYPYLLYNADPTTPNQIPHRIQPPSQATGLMAEAQLASSDIRDATGIYQASLGQKSNETSGVAIESRKAEGDVSTFVYIDNLSLAIAHTGRQLVKLIPKVYDTRRVQRILYDDGSEEHVVLNQTVIGADGQEKVRHDPRDLAAVKGQAPKKPNAEYRFYDLNIGKYDVSVSTGPSFSTRRQEAAQGMLEMMKVAPASAPLLMPRLAKAQDWPGAEEIAEDLEKLLPPQLQKPPVGPDGQPLPMPEPAPPPEDPAIMKARAELELKAKGAEQDQAIQAAKLQAQREEMAAKRDLQQQQHELDEAQAVHKASLAERQFALDKWIAEQNVALEREQVSAKIGIQQEAAAREAITSGVPQIQAAQEGIGNAMQDMAHLVQSHAILQAAPTSIIRDKATNAPLGTVKNIPPEVVERLHPAIRALAQPRALHRDEQGNIAGDRPVAEGVA